VPRLLRRISFTRQSNICGYAWFFTNSTWRNPSVCSSLAELGMSSSHLSIAQNATTLWIIPHTTIINPTWRRQLSHPEYMLYWTSLSRRWDPWKMLQSPSVSDIVVVASRGHNMAACDDISAHVTGDTIFTIQRINWADTGSPRQQTMLNNINNSRV
jgi:hypothetical protein